MSEESVGKEPDAQGGEELEGAPKTASPQPPTETPEPPLPTQRIWPVLVATVVAVLLLELFAGSDKTKFDELALGRQTQSLFARRSGSPIHVSKLAEVELLATGSAKRKPQRRALLLGNSQLHAINQLKKGQQTASALLFDRLQPSGTELLTVSFPNANLQEHLLAFHHARGLLTDLKLVVLSLVFDDTREAEIRDEWLAAARSPQVAKALQATKIGRKIVTAAAKLGKDELATDLGGLRDTIQERSERAINDWLSAHWKLWRARPQARGRLFATLFRLRNTALRIDAQSKRPLLEAPYRANLEALSSLIQGSKKAGIDVLLYVAPLRDDVETPYIKADYDRFRKDCAALAKQEKVGLLDLGGLVPGRFWGTKNAAAMSQRAELDFMHFQAAGHKLLAEALAQQVGRRMTEPRP